MLLAIIEFIIIYVATKVGAKDIVETLLLLIAAIPLLIACIHTIEYLNHIIKSGAKISELISFLQQYSYSTAVKILEEKIEAIGATIATMLLGIIIGKRR